ncbi:hypothetical protein RHMOL_Rhmol11G0001100 [Rhododendron molle]|uniref:Uncharacterized protein n=1 Tax=Rhododendron molle TaxID=49168 RepID=A0ACC0LMH8_RHOML|nr:hypothetical protein RHMOL_Rhmol11G0001100 [Rhododendron molle]
MSFHCRRLSEQPWRPRSDRAKRPNPLETPGFGRRSPLSSMLGWMSWGDKSGQRQKKGSMDDGVARSKPLGAGGPHPVEQSNRTLETPGFCRR